MKLKIRPQCSVKDFSLRQKELTPEQMLPGAAALGLCPGEAGPGRRVVIALWQLGMDATPRLLAQIKHVNIHKKTFSLICVSTLCIRGVVAGWGPRPSVTTSSSVISFSLHRHFLSKLTCHPFTNTNKMTNLHSHFTSLRSSNVCVSTSRYSILEI